MEIAPLVRVTSPCLFTLRSFADGEISERDSESSSESSISALRFVEETGRGVPETPELLLGVKLGPTTIRLKYQIIQIIQIIKVNSNNSKFPMIKINSNNSRK